MSSTRTVRFTAPEESFQKLEADESFSSFFIHKHVKELISTDFSNILQLLKEELAFNTIFDEVWKEATEIFKKNQMPKLRAECQIAIIAYTIESGLYADFNEKCRKLDGDSSWNNFPYKSFYALLARSIHDIDNDPPVTIQTYYRGVMHKVSNLKVGDHIFPRQFMSCKYNNVKEAEGLGDCGGTLMTFQDSPLAACGIKKLSVFPEEEELLVFPWSVFEVTKIVPGEQDEVYLKTVESFEKDLPYCGNYKSKGVAVSNN